MPPDPEAERGDDGAAAASRLPSGLLGSPETLSVDDLRRCPALNPGDATLTASQRADLEAVVAPLRERIAAAKAIVWREDGRLVARLLEAGALTKLDDLVLTAADEQAMAEERADLQRRLPEIPAAELDRMARSRVAERRHDFIASTTDAAGAVWFATLDQMRDGSREYRRHEVAAMGDAVARIGGWFAANGFIAADVPARIRARARRVRARMDRSARQVSRPAPTSWSDGAERLRLRRGAES